MTSKLSYDDILLQILAKTSLTKEEVEEKINERIASLSGLVSKEGAAIIVANELHVSLLESLKKTVPLDRIIAGMSQFCVEGTVSTVYPLKEFTKQTAEGNVRTGHLLSLVLEDEKASMRVILWNDHALAQAHLQPGTKLRLSDCRAQQSLRSGIEIHSTGRSILEILGEEQKQAIEYFELQKIAKLPAHKTVQVSGTLVEIFPVRYIEVCPQCSRRMRLKDGGFACDNHGIGIPTFSWVASAILDDGTSTIRLVFFQEQAQNFFRIPFIEYKEKKEELQKHLNTFLGEEILCLGKINNNEMYKRQEIIVNNAHICEPQELLAMKNE